MHKEKQGFGDSAVATLQTKADGQETVSIAGYYHVECRDAAGNLKWEEEFPNLVNAVGKQLLLDTLLRTSGTYTTVGPFLGLISGASPTFAAADTMTSHSGWTELAAGTAYSGSRPTVSWTAASAGSKASTATTFTISATNTVAGALLATVASGTSGTLYSAGSFTGGNRTVAASDTLNVTYTASTTAS